MELLNDHNFHSHFQFQWLLKLVQQQKSLKITTFEAFDFEGDAAVDVDEGGAIIIYSALIFSTFGFYTKLRPFTFL
jgi:hypothetical protein